MALTAVATPDSSTVYCASEPIIYQVHSTNAGESGFRFKCRISRAGDPTYLIDLSVPRNGNNVGVFDVAQVAKDTLYWTGEELLTTLGTEATQGDVFSVILSSRWLDSSGNEQTESIASAYYFHAILCNPAYRAKSSTTFTAGLQDPTWTRFLPPRDTYWYNLTNVPQTWNPATRALTQWPSVSTQQKAPVVELGTDDSAVSRQNTSNVVYHHMAHGFMTITRQNSDDLNSQNPYISIITYNDAGEATAYTYKGPSSGAGMGDGTGVSGGRKPFYNVGVGWRQLVLDPALIVGMVSARWYSFAFHDSPVITPSSQIGPTYLVRIDDDECFYDDNLNIIYADRGGSWNQVDFATNRQSQTRVTTQTTYTPLPGNYTEASQTVDFNISSYGRGSRVIDTVYSRSLTLTTGWVTDEDQVYFEDLMVSPDIYLVGSQIVASNTPIRLLCTTKSLDRKEKRQDGLIRYTMSFQIAENNRG